jgi:hypothetical protein
MEDGENFFYCVYEHGTEQAVDFYYFKEDAENCAKFFSSGGGFDGFTPRFMLTEVNIPLEKQDVNRKFDQVFTD